MEVDDERADVARLVRRRLRLLVLHPAEVRLQPFFERGRVALVDGIKPTARRRRDVRVREHELPHRRVQREPVHPVAGREHEHRGRPVDDVARGHLLGPRKERGVDGGLLALGKAVHREDGPHRHVHVDIGRAVERVEQDDVPPDVPGARRDRDDLVGLFRDDQAGLATEPESLDELGVGDGVELLLDLALDVRLTRVTEHVEEPGAPDVAVYHLRGEGQIADEPGKRPGRDGDAILLLEDELLQRLEPACRKSGGGHC